MPTGTCVACQCPNVRLASATTDCACLVCERCAIQFMEAGVCGICETPFSDEEFASDEEGDAEDAKERP
jgi:hypothetical protein